MKPLFNKKSFNVSFNAKEWIYAFTDIYFAGARTLLDIFYTYFLSQVLGLSLALAGTIYASALISRALAEPIAGICSDHWRTRWGKRKPFFVIGIPFIFLSFLLLWYPFDAGTSGKLVIAWTGAILYGIVSGMMMAPYAAMGPDLVEDYHGRTYLSNLRHIFQLIAIAVSVLVFSHYLTKGLTADIWYRVFVVCFALLFTLPFVALTLFIPEKQHDFQEGVWTKAIHKIVLPFRLPVFCWYSVMNTCIETILVLMPAMFPFYLKFYTDTLDYLPGYAIALSIGAGLTLFLMMTIYKEVCKITWYRVGSIALGVVCAGMFIVTPAHHIWLFPLFVILGMSVATLSTACLSMQSDLADYTSKVYHAHMQAVVYAVTKSLAQWGAGACVFIIFRVSAIQGSADEAVISGELAKGLLLGPVALLTLIALLASLAYHLDRSAVDNQ